jgi:nucleotide-binding universal stress UspA family protein
LSKKGKNKKRAISKELNKNKSKEIKRITALVDGSENSKKASEMAIGLGKKFDVDVTIIYEMNSYKIARVFPHPDRVITSKQLELVSIMKIQAHSFLFELEKRCNKIGVNVETKLIEDVPYLKIIKKAEQQDLIVIGINKKMVKRRIIFPSISEKILKNAHSSVMFVR